MDIRTYNLTTSEFVKPLKVKEGTARRAFCVQGHYLGAVPIKLLNNQLRWSMTDQRRILNGLTPDVRGNHG